MRQKRGISHIDFSSLRPILAPILGWRSGRGWMPFDPVSFLPLHGWQITNTWSRAETLRQLRNPRNANYASLFGFRDGWFPTEGDMRYFLTALGAHSTSDETSPSTRSSRSRSPSSA